MDPTEHLKQFLFLLAHDSNFQFNNTTREQLRKALFLAATNNGKYIAWLFPNTFPHVVPTEVMATKIEHEYSWKLTNYLNGNDIRINHHNDSDWSMPCARIFRKGEPIYRCLTCGFDETCALCSHCFDASVHLGHKVHVTVCQRENGGVCDCGDPEAWLKEFPCRSSSNTLERKEVKPIDLSGPLPEEFENSLLQTFQLILDFVIDIMSRSDLQFDTPGDDPTLEMEKIERNTEVSQLDSTKYGLDSGSEDPASDKFSLIVYNDQIRQYRDAVQRIHLASKKVKLFATMVTDKVQSYGKAKVITSSNLLTLIERQTILSATGLATCIRNQRDIFREEMCDELLIWFSDFTESELIKVNVQTKNLYCKAFCGKWRIGLFHHETNSHVPYEVGKLDSLKIPKIPNPVVERNFQSHWFFNPSRWNLADELCEDRDYNITEEEYLQSSHLGSRLQYFIYMDVRFWKSIRTLLHDMYSTSLITNLQYKRRISFQYVDIYPTIADMFLTMDREPEWNVMATLSTQLFTCPSNSTLIIQHGDLARIFASIYGYLTVGEIRSPENIQVTNEISIKSLKNRRWSQIFFDIGYILSRSTDPVAILTTNVIPMACDILALFQGKPVMKRERTTHVEYESPDYTAFFQSILVIYLFGEVIAQTLNKINEASTNDEIHNKPFANEDEMYNYKKSFATNAISYVIKFLFRMEQNNYPGMVEDLIDINLSPHKKISKEYIGGNIIQHYNIDEEKVSFLHPLHSFLCWLIELANFRSPFEIKEVFESATIESGLARRLEIPNPVTSIFDYPLRTIVLMSQIKSGFWVRNGYSVRYQLQFYRNTGLRENGYMRDLFLTQVLINTKDPNLVCFLIFSRWLFMNGWIVEQVESAHSIDSIVEVEGQAGNQVSYDQKTLPYMLEECMNFFIHILTEDLSLRSLDPDKIKECRIKNEILHNLCFGPMNYTKLCLQIPDHILLEKKFDLILAELAIFTPPKSASDTGVYKLKEEFLDQVNPYYFNYTANTKDDAIKFLKDKIHKETGAPVSEIVLEPKIRNPEELGIYRYNGNFSASSYFSDFLIRTFTYIQEAGIDLTESLLETALNLIHICSYENNVDLEQYGSFYDRFVNISDTFGTSVSMVLYEFLTDEIFQSYHSKIRFIFKVFENKYHNLGEILTDQVTNFDPLLIQLNRKAVVDESEIKMKLARDRKAKLMAKFKKQQSKFLKNNNFEEPATDIEMEDNEEALGWQFPEPHCLLCQNAAENAGPFGIITYFGKSSEFRNVPFDDKYWLMRSFSDSANLDEDEVVTNELEGHCKSENWKAYSKKIKDKNVIGPGFSNPNHVSSKLVSLSCGHGMHFQCYVNFLNNNKNKLTQITRNYPENIEHKEFLCPLCKAINNMFIPILWTNNNRSLKAFLEPNAIANCNNPFENLNKSLLQDYNWYRQFANISDADIEDFGMLNGPAKDMILQQPEKGTDQKNFRLLLSNMFQISSFLSFPHVFKADSTFILVNTIKSTEIMLRGTSAQGKLVISQLSNNTLINLRTLSEFRNTSVLMKVKNWIHSMNPKDDAYAKILASLFSLAPDSINDTILEADFFELLVNIVPIKAHRFSFNTILKICFFCQILQNMATFAKEMKNHKFYKNSEYSILDIPLVPNVEDKVAHFASQLFQKFYVEDESDLAAEYYFSNPLFGHVIYSMLVKTSTVFLRRAVIFAFVQCASLDNLDLESDQINLEADRLCSFMKIPNVGEILVDLVAGTPSFELMVFHSFISTVKAPKFNWDQLDTVKLLEYPGIIKLVDLPERLDIFFTDYYYSDKFNNPHMTIEDPAICLFCGEVVDTQKAAIGCKEGQCTTHFLKECTNEVGIFLLPKDRSLLLLHKNGGSFYGAPFLDVHGELPTEAKKIKTLYLMDIRYSDFIRNVWLQHNVPNLIARNLEGVADAGGWETL